MFENRLRASLVQHTMYTASSRSVVYVR